MWLFDIPLPDGKDTAGLGKARLLLNTANSLLEDGGDFGGSGLRVGGVALGGS